MSDLREITGHYLIVFLPWRWALLSLWFTTIRNLIIKSRFMFSIVQWHLLNVNRIKGTLVSIKTYKLRMLKQWSNAANRPSPTKQARKAFGTCLLMLVNQYGNKKPFWNFLNNSRAHHANTNCICNLWLNWKLCFI